MRNKNFTDLLKRGRLAARVKFRDLGAATGLSIGELSDIEAGRKLPPDLETVERIEKALKIEGGALVAAASAAFDFQKGKAVHSHRYAIFVTWRQLWLIKEFVDICSFLLMGKFEHPLWTLFISKDLDYEEFHKKAFALKRVVFPELDRHSSYGVGWTTDDSQQNRSQIGYEIESMIAHEMWKRETDRSDGGVRAYAPLHYSDEALIRVEDLGSRLPSTNELLNEAGERILRNAVQHKLHASQFVNPSDWEFRYLVDAVEALEDHRRRNFPAEVEMRNI